MCVFFLNSGVTLSRKKHCFFMRAIEVGGTSPGLADVTPPPDPFSSQPSDMFHLHENFSEPPRIRRQGSIKSPWLPALACAAVGSTDRTCRRSSGNFRCAPAAAHGEPVPALRTGRTSLNLETPLRYLPQTSRRRRKHGRGR